MRTRQCDGRRPRRAEARPAGLLLEEIDNPAAPVGMLKLSRWAKAEPELRNDLFDGIVGIVAEGKAAEVGKLGGRPLSECAPGARRDAADRRSLLFLE